MSSKLVTYTQMAEETASQVTGSYERWTGFLDSAARLYKYPFSEQLMIYAQRPEAIACAPIQTWNVPMNRVVKRGAKGIALIDYSLETPKLHYVFDIADTEEGRGFISDRKPRQLQFWQVTADTKSLVAEMIAPTPGSRDESLADTLHSIAGDIAVRYYSENADRILNSIEGSYLGNLNERGIEAAFIDAVTVSVAHCLMSRCGLDPRDHLSYEMYQPVFDFNTQDSVYVLGEAVSRLSGQMLRKIETIIKNHEKDQQKEEQHRGTGLQTGRGLLAAGRRDPGGMDTAAIGEIRTSSPGVFAKASEPYIHQNGHIEHIVASPDGDRADSQRAHGAVDRADGEGAGRDGAVESRGSDEVGRADEQYPGIGGGNHTPRPNLRIVPLPTVAEQLHILDIAEDVRVENSHPPLFSLSQQIIDEVLTSGGNELDSTLRIAAYFKKDHPTAENAVFLQKEYGNGGKGFIFGGERVSIWFNEQGIHIAQGDSVIDAEHSTLVTWNQAATRTRELLDMGRYMPQSELNKVDDYEINALAEHVWYTHQDRMNGYEFSFMDEELFKGGFPDSTARIAELLANSEQRQPILDGLIRFAAEYAENPQLLRFRSAANHLISAITGLADLECEPLVFAADETVSSARPSFITQDEIDLVLIGSGEQQNTRKLDTYAYFLQSHTLKEKVSFLSHLYGTGGVSRTGFYESHDGKGISYSRENNHMPYDKVLLPWPKVARRIDELIAEGRYMSQRELDYIPEYEKTILSRSIVSPYLYLPEDMPRPYAYDASYEDAVKSVRQQLDDPARVAEILSQMEEMKDRLSVLNGSYDAMQQALDDLTAYQNGTYSLFTPVHTTTEPAQARPATPEQHTPQPSEKTNAEYDLQLGAVVYLGIEDFEIYSFDDETVMLRDASAPLFTRELTRAEFDRKLRENRLNDHLIKVDAAPAPETTTVNESALEPVIRMYEPIQPEPKTLQPEPELDTITPAWEKPKPRARTQSFDAFPGVPMSERHNFTITDDDLGAGGAKTKYRNNVEAIRTLQKIEAENSHGSVPRLATPEEQEILSRYVGWGGLADAFDEDKSAWTNEYAELQSLLTPEEYKSARASTVNAHYTSPTVIKAMYKAVENMGFRTGNVLEPSCGIGNFFGLVPESMSGSKLFGVELDNLTGRIAQQLYQKNSIAIQGYESTNLPDSFFDLAVGNVPFGNYPVLDKRYDKHKFSIHDYFFAKTLDKVRPGGVMAFVTSKYMMDAKNPEVRRYIAQRADMLGSIRLPNTAFKSNAGTEVTADIIFLQKRSSIIDIEPEWVHLGQTENGIPINSYFAEHPEMVLGTMSIEDGLRMYGAKDNSTCLPFPDADLSEQLSEAIKNIHAEITEYERGEEEREEDNSIPADPTVRNFSYTLVDGQIYYRQDSRMRPVEMPATTQNRVKGMIALRECVRDLIMFQTESYTDSAIKAEQEKLNRLYDDFSKKYGLINSRGNSTAFAQDSAYPLLCSLEVIDENGELERRADMFQKRTIRPHETVTHVDTAVEALAVSMSEKARVDLPYMAQLSDMSEDALAKELEGIIFRLPAPVDGDGKPKYVTADEYLSGNVREKLAVAKQAAEKDDELQINVRALEEAIPKDLTAAEISVRLGATWIPVNVIQQFMNELLQTPFYLNYRIKVNYSSVAGEWSITNKSADKANIHAYNTYGTQRISAYKIIEESLNLRDARVFDNVVEDGVEKRVLNQKETSIAQAKQEIIRAKFEEWIWKDPKRREQLCRLYNDKFNSIRPREYDGSHITFVGMNPEITLRKHQIDAIAHILYGGNTLLAHEVGAGKTYEMVAAAMESRRLGLCGKSLFVVPNHITGQWASEFLQLYPSANILVASEKDFETKNRKRFCARIATGDYDAVIIGHSQFEKIPMSAQRQKEMLERQIDELIDGIEEVKRNNGERFTVKQMEKIKKGLEVKIAKLNDQSRKDDVVTFEELGIDRLFIDEAHYYKNLYLVTKMRNVSGIAQTEAQKSSDLFMKTQYLDDLTGGRGTVFATGTPISNSMVEMYTMQRYLQYSLLVRSDLQHFDAWASTFGETITAIELAPEGTGYRAKTRFAKFHNLPELMSMFRMVADIQTADMLNLPVPKANFHTEVIQPSDWQKDMVAELAKRAENIRKRRVRPNVDNMLKVTNDGRKLALDQRLINPMLPDDPDGKASTCANNVFRIWDETRDKRLTQLVFCDLSTPHGDGSFNVYDDIKQKLIAKGIPEEEIAFIHNANTKAQKNELFAKVRKGQIRVLMGSTQKMGAGTNVQDRLIALHDKDCPWRPADLAQRLGRIVRQGNQNPEVEIFRYVTEGTFDSYLYQIVENKQRFISQVMTGKTPVRSAEDVDDTALSYAEIKALATGNPLIIEKCQLEMDVGRLKILHASHLSQRYALEDKILKEYPQTIKRLTERIAKLKVDIETVSKNPADKDSFPPMTIGGILYVEKKDAGTAIIEACKAMTSPDPVALGEYRGFKMILSFDSFSKEYRITLSGALSHSIKLGTDAHGNITRLDNALEGFAETLKHHMIDLEVNQKQAEAAKGELDRPFPQEQEYAEKLTRLAELNVALDIGRMDDQPIMDDDGAVDDEPETPEEKNESASILESIKNKSAEISNAPKPENAKPLINASATEIGGGQ